MTSAPSGITVRGVGRAARTPDRATVVMGAEVRAGSASEAHRAASQRLGAILIALTGLGIPASDIATQAIELSPTYDYPDGGQRLIGHAARQMLHVTVRRLDDLAAVIDRGVAAGADLLTGVSLGIGDPAEAVAEALRTAVLDARARAEVLVAAAGLRLGSAMAIREGPPGWMPHPLGRMEAMTADTAVAPGSTEVSAEVEVTFAIEPAG